MLASGIAILPQPTFSWVLKFTFLKMVARKVMATSPVECLPAAAPTWSNSSRTLSSTASWASV